MIGLLCLRCCWKSITLHDAFGCHNWVWLCCCVYLDEDFVHDGEATRTHKPSKNSVTMLLPLVGLSLCLHHASKLSFVHIYHVFDVVSLVFELVALVQTWLQKHYATQHYFVLVWALSTTHWEFVVMGIDGVHTANIVTMMYRANGKAVPSMVFDIEDVQRKCLSIRNCIKREPGFPRARPGWWRTAFSCSHLDDAFVYVGEATRTIKPSRMQPWCCYFW